MNGRRSSISGVRSGKRGGHPRVAILLAEENAMRVTSNGKVWRSEAEWRTICERFAQSGLGVAEFCVREKLAMSSFQTWYRRCAGAERRKGKFIEVLPAAAGAGCWEVEVELPNGTRLHLRG